MKRLPAIAAVAASLLVAACSETQEVCTTYGNKTTCRTERVPSEAERKSSLDHAVNTLDFYNCIENGEGNRAYCGRKYTYEGM